jgi:uncharacterized protein YaeQ
MTQTATVHHWKISLSDVDRGVYESLDLRFARHPSESARYLVTRVLAYCLCYEEGIAFSKGGVSAADEPPVLIRDALGGFRAWIDVGSPSAERLHRAAKLAARVALFTSVVPVALAAKARDGHVHRAASIEVWRLEPAWLDTVAERVERNLALELTQNDGRLYLTLPNGELVECGIERASLLAATP